MNIAIVTHKVIRGDGQGRVNYEIALSALERGHGVILIASSIAPELQNREGLRWIQITVDGWPSDLIRNQIFAARSALWIKRHRGEFEKLMVNGFITWAKSDINTAHLVHSTWVKIMQDAPMVYSIKSIYQSIYSRLNAKLERKAFAKAKKVVAVSRKVRQELLDIGVPDSRIEVILNGVDLEEFYPGRSDRTSLELPEDVPLALFIGDILTTRKNLDTALNAVKRIQNIHLAVAGRLDGSIYPGIAEKMGIKDRIHFLGFRKDTANILRSCDLLVLPARYEPFGLVVLEAMASGIPVVLSSTVGASELVTQECGVVISDPNDDEALALALESIISDPERRLKMGAAAREAAQKYGWKDMTLRYIALLEQSSNHDSAMFST